MRKHLQRILLVLLCTDLLSSSQIVFAQQNSKSIPLPDALKKITRALGTEFIYDKELLQAKKTSYDLSNIKGKQVEDVLKAILYPNGFVFLYIKTNYYTIVPKDRVGANPSPVVQMNSYSPGPDPANTNTSTNFKTTDAASLRRVSGIVSDDKNQPLSGISVSSQNAGAGTVTDGAGKFFLTVRQKDVLVISSVGFQTHEVPVTNQADFKINLLASQKQLDEVVVIGYGTTTQRRNTGSVGSINAEIIEKQPIANVLAALPGRISGTLVAQNNGLPGSGIQIQIRGQGSLSSGTIPLYVIDGVPYTNFNGGLPATDNLNSFGTSGANGSISPFGLINPADIERIDILKDADATSIYGSRGSNGVVLITTKKGKSGKTKVGFNISNGSTEINHFIPMLSLQQYLQLRREAFANDGVTPTTANAPDLLVWDTTKATDWQKEFLGGTGHYQDIQATLSAGDARTRFLFSTNYRRETTLFPGDDVDKRFSNRINLDHTSLDKRLSASFAASYSSGKTNLLTSDLTSVYNLPPNLPLYDAGGKLFWTTQFTNPLSSILKRYKGVTSNLISSANFRYTVLPGLNLKANFGYTITDLDQKTANPASSNNPANNPVSSAVFANNKAQNWIIEPTAEYTTNISEGKLSALVGASWQHNTSSGYFLSASNYSNEALLGTLSAAGTVTVSYNNIVEYKYNAVFGRVNYDWKGKYFINTTFRRDGSSRFGPANRFGNFGAVGAAWVFSQEPFIKTSLPFLSFGKLRGSYGTTGDDQISNYLYLRLYGNTTAYLGNPATTPGQIPNDNIQWETTRKFEAALELGFLKDRILLTANYYRNRSSNQILSIAVPTQSGTNSYTANVPALIQNSGLELELNTTNFKSKNFEWKTSLNLTVPKNKLVSFPGLERSFYATSYIVGKPINFTRAYHYLGVDPANGRATYEDVDKDGAITFANDRKVMPLGTPYYGGLSNTLTYKSFELDVFFQFNHRFGTTNIISSPVGTLRNQNTSVLDRWRKVGDVAPFAGASTTAGSPLATSWGFYGSSDAVYGDASYLKLRSASLSYNLPADWTEKIKMSNCRLYVQGQNLFTWAKNKYIFDTETTVQGGPSGLGTGTIGQVMPPLRTIVFGINCSF